MTESRTTTGESQATTGSGPRLTSALILQLRDGEASAGELLDDLYRKSLIRFCVGYLGSDDEARDVVQNVFCKVLASDTVPDHFRAWIYTIARNRCLDVLRARGRRRDDQSLPAESQLQAEITGSFTRLVRKELHSRLGQLLAALPAQQREVLRLRYTEQLSRAEIAQVLELPESVVKSRLFEGLERLRKHKSLADMR